MSDQETSTLQLEVRLGVGADSLGLTEPQRLGEWLCSHAVVVDDRVACVVEEEYGYRRQLDWRIEQHCPGVRLSLVADRVEREWDGSDGAPVGPSSPPQRWPEPELVGSRLQVEVDHLGARIRWDAFRGDARDACRRQGLALWFAAERALASHLLAIGERYTETRSIRPGHEWFGTHPLLLAQPGDAWARGRVLVAICERRIVASCDDGVLDVRIERRRRSPGTLRATWLPSSDASRAPAWLPHVATMLAGGASIHDLDA